MGLIEAVYIFNERKYSKPLHPRHRNPRTDQHSQQCHRLTYLYRAPTTRNHSATAIPRPL